MDHMQNNCPYRKYNISIISIKQSLLIVTIKPRFRYPSNLVQTKRYRRYTYIYKPIKAETMVVP